MGSPGERAAIRGCNCNTASAVYSPTGISDAGEAHQHRPHRNTIHEQGSNCPVQEVGLFDADTSLSILSMLDGPWLILTSWLQLYMHADVTAARYRASPFYAFPKHV